ncbi:hypothetical protein M426DRAFT_210717 [Hypoxylon sp. CI-4A]|nr:hypothetical protein M426DRAFT_210717 [Hypoxylon sp. CI-4A]
MTVAVAVAVAAPMVSQNPRRPSINHSISFAKWTDSFKRKGEDGDGNIVEFVSPSDLKAHWSWKAVRDILKDFREVNAKVEIILRAYIRVFSILVSIGHVDYLAEFMEYGLSDERLPLEHRPPRWPESKSMNEVFDEFLECQWKFCPLKVTRHTLVGQRLHSRHILPIASKKPLRELHGDSEVIRVEFHPDCIEEGLPTTMVLKTYTDPKLYKTEVSAFTMMYNSASNAWNSSPENIIEYYGHFIQKDKHCLLLECAQYGSLDTYLKDIEPPASAEEMFAFWKSMFRLIKGLVLIHGLGALDEDTTTAFRGAHQDIKPGNILVTGMKSTNKYDITLKIADFDLSDFWQISSEDPNALGVDNRGDQWYSAPECIANHSVLYRFDNRIGSEVDIWSLGCVYSEAAVWAVCGQPGIESYLNSRLQETQRFESMDSSGFAGCFHNGHEPLDAVTLMHNHILKSRRHWDTVTPGIIELVREKMLLDPMSPRKSAKDLLLLSESLLKEAQDKAREAGYLSSDTHETPSPSPPPSSKITVEEVQRYRSDIKKRRPPNERVAAQLDLLLEKIKGRDQIFLIDDSKSMKTQHREDVSNTFIALSYLAKRIDENDIDVFFTSNPSRRHHQRRTSKLVNEVEYNYNRNAGGTSAMEASMSEVIDYIIEEKLPNPHVTLVGIPRIPQFLIKRPRITLFVFTDGLWGNGAASVSGVEKEIRRLINNVKTRNLSRIAVTIQFIRFGDDADAIDRLKYLDTFGKHTDWDIVDTKSYKDDVPDMFIGSIDDEVDDNDEWEMARLRLS